MSDKNKIGQSDEQEDFLSLEDDERIPSRPDNRQGTKNTSHKCTASNKSGSRPGSSRRKSGKRRKAETEQFVHYIIAGVLIIMVVVAAVKLIIWNIGKDSGYDPDNITSEFETEALDYIQPLDPELLAGREDDGITTIVALGNNPFSDERGKDGLAELIAEKCDAVVYNCAFPDTYISMKIQNIPTISLRMH